MTKINISEITNDYLKQSALKTRYPGFNIKIEESFYKDKINHCRLIVDTVSSTYLYHGAQELYYKPTFIIFKAKRRRLIQHIENLLEDSVSRMISIMRINIAENTKSQKKRIAIKGLITFPGEIKQ